MENVTVRGICLKYDQAHDMMRGKIEGINNALKCSVSCSEVNIVEFTPRGMFVDNIPCHSYEHGYKILDSVLRSSSTFIELMN
jgi:hypothetical protein